MGKRNISPHPGDEHSSDWIARPYSIVFTSVGLFILILGIAIFLGYRQFETTRHNALSADKTTANLLADLTLEHNRLTMGILQSYAYRHLFIDAVKNKDLAGVHRHLSDLKKNAQIDLTFVTDAHGILWANFPVLPEAIGKDLSDHDWYKGISSHWKPYISTVFKLIVGDKPLAAAVCVPIFDEKERVIGILGSSQQLSSIDDAIERVPFSPYTTVNVIDRMGYIIYSNKFSYRENVAAYRFFPSSEAAVKEKRRQIEINDPQKDQEKSYLTVVPVGDSGWTVIIERSLKDLYRPNLRRFAETGAVSFLLFLLITFSLVYLRKVSLFRKTERILQVEVKLRQGEKALSNSEKKYRNIFENATEGIFQSTPEGRYVSVNPAFARIGGYDSSDEMIATVSDIQKNMYVHQEDRARLLKLLEKQDAINDFEAEIRRRDNAIIWISMNARTIRDQGGKVILLEGTITDITGRKKAEAEIKKLNTELEQRVIERTTQLEAANMELEAFSYSVSHDLRGPLRAIDGFSRIILEDYADTLDAEGNRLLGIIRTNTKQMDQLITDLLALSRVSKTELQVSRVDMGTMVNSIYHEITFPEVRQGFVFTVAPLPDGSGDPALLRQVWVNLLSNAVKFTMPRDERRIEVTGRAEKDMNIYSIRDTGVGFNPKYTPKLFGVFQRLHKADEFEGTGVGLAIVRRIIHRHGGRVWAEGKINGGATFSFSLPRKEADHE